MLRLSCLTVRRAAQSRTGSASRLKRMASTLPPKSGGGGGAGKLLAGTVVLTAGGVGGVVAYAANDKDFRRSVEDTVPGSGELLNSILGPADPPAALQEKTKPKALSSPPSKLKLSGPVVVTPPKEEKDPVEPPKAAESLEKQPESATTISTVPEPPLIPPPTPAVEKAPEPKPKLPVVKTEKAEEKTSSTDSVVISPPTTINTMEQPVPSDIENSTLEKMLDELCDEMKAATSAAVASYDQSSDAVVSHINVMLKVLETNVANKDESAWNQVFQAATQKSETLRSAEERERDAEAAIRIVAESIEAGRRNRSTASNPQLAMAEDAVSRAMSQLRQAKARMTEVETEAKGMEQYRNLVEEGRQQFHREMASIMPDMKPGEKNTNLTDDEFMFITHAYRMVLHLQQELAKQQTLEQQRFKQSLEKQKLEVQVAASEKIDSELERQKRELESEHQRRLTALREEAESELRSQLRRQAAAHLDHVTDVLTVQEAELSRKHLHELQEKVSDAESSYQTALSSIQGRLEGLTTSLEARAADEKTALTAQRLWTACLAMDLAVRGGNPHAQTWEETVKPLEPTVSQIKAVAGEADEFVSTVLSTIPATALNRGVYTEQSLRERFTRVERVARRVASIGDDGGSLIKYGLSFLKSILMVDISERTPGLVSDEPIDVSQLSTLDILCKSRYSLEEGNIERAVQLMLLLKGEPGRVARDWVNEARLHLETKLAADVLLAHAANISAQVLPTTE